jgi:hypothetical protein
MKNDTATGQEYQVQAMSDESLQGAIRDLSKSGGWNSRLRQLQSEMQRRRSKRRAGA